MNRAIDIGISAEHRKKIADGLCIFMADSFSLYILTHYYHWNVKGPMFNTLHTMFMQQYTEQWNALDEIAERIRALGHNAPGSMKTLKQLQTVPEFEGVPEALTMVHNLVISQEGTAKTARALLPLVNEANDQPTADLLTQRLTVHEKAAWMLRSILEE